MPLTVFQSIPVDGIIIVTSPQELVSMIVEKAVNMAGMMNIPVLGLVENMAFVECPDCGKKIFPFGESQTAKVALEEGIPLLAQLPIKGLERRQKERSLGLALGIQKQGWYVSRGGSKYHSEFWNFES